MNTEEAKEVRRVLAVIVDSVDYIGDGPQNRACGPTEMVAAVLPRELLIEAKQLLQNTRHW